MRETLLLMVRFFDELQVPYCLVDGLAVAVYGVPRFTGNLDFLVAPQAQAVRPEIERFACQRGAIFSILLLIRKIHSVTSCD